MNTNADARARIAEQAAASAEAMILGALGDGALADVLAGGAVTGNAEDVLAQASGVGVATGGSSALRERSGGGDGSGQRDGLGGLAGSGNAGMAATTGMVEERQISGRINLEGGGDIGGSGDFDAALVVREIRRRLSAIQRCYETELRNDPTLNGRVVAAFTIQPTGTLSNVRATENTTGSNAVGTCVTNVIRRIRFTEGPEGGPVNYSFPFVFAVQN